MPSNPYQPGSTEYKNYENMMAQNAQMQAEIQKMQLERDMRPKTPTWQSLLDDSGNLQGKYALGQAEQLTPQIEQMLSGVNLDTRALEALRAQALSTEQSPWTNLMLQQQALQEQQAADKALRDEAGQNASAWSQLAMRGGLSGGERERIATAGARSLAETGQKVAAEGRANRLGILTEAEKERLNTLRALPGMEVQALSPAFQKVEMFGKAKDQDISRNVDTNKYNIANLINERNSKGQFDMGNYAEAMKAWASEKQAQATEKSGK